MTMTNYCTRCNKWAGANAYLPGQPRDNLCSCVSPGERRANRVEPAVTRKQLLDSIHEYAWTFHGYHGRGPEVEAKHAEVVRLLGEAGIA